MPKSSESSLETLDSAHVVDQGSWQGATVLAEADDDLLGKTLNDTYRVERVLGEGGMGRVYQARHTRIAQKQLAVKVLHPEFVRNTEVLARFQREAETAASISHPNVVAVYDVDRTPRGLPYLVCEYLEGIDLSDHLDRVGKLNLLTALHIARQLCDGLEAAHARGVIHRDLKPHNVFLVGDFAAGVPPLPLVKILDFGLSKFMDDADGNQVTKTGVIMGTPAYMSPEQALGQRADHRADINGVGAILYTSLTGRMPFDEVTPQATVLAVIGSEPPRPRSIDKSIPEHAELVIQRAMAKDPKDRYSDMAALTRALERLIETEGTGGYELVGPVRAQLPTMSEPRPSLKVEAERIRAARPELVWFLLLAGFLFVGSAAIAVAGLEQTRGWTLTRLELGLALAVALVGAATPAILWLHRIRQKVWGNTSRVMALLGELRLGVITTLVAYGLAWLGFRVFDRIVVRLSASGRGVDVAWPGWDLLLPIVGLGAALAAMTRVRLVAGMVRGYRRSLMVALVALAPWALALAMVGLGLRLRAGAEPTPHVASAASAEASARPQRADSLPLSPPSSPGSALPRPTVRHAPAEDLREATAKGAEALAPLAEQYPDDPLVLKPLMLAYAARAATLADAMATARRLLRAAPDEAHDADVGYLVAKATERTGEPERLAWLIITEEMGTAGPDLLYNLMLTNPKVADHAEDLLGDPAIQKRFSPALAIAYDLRTANSCAARLPLLDRAIEQGDARAVNALMGLSTGSKRGCGKSKRKPCLSACPEHAEQFRTAAEKISARLRGAGK
jgi:serine/threonine protein kinase